MNVKSPLLWVGILGLLGIVTFCAINISGIITDSNPTLVHSTLMQPFRITGLMMVGLSLIVALVILLLIFFKATDTADKEQALGLPSGSIRALIALALVLMYVCMSVFLYKGVSSNGLEVTKHNLTKAQVDALKTQFSLVIDQPEPKNPTGGASGNSSGGGGGNSPGGAGGATPGPAGNGGPAATDDQRFEVTYYPGRSKEADDLAKLMLTQLATVFVTVIGFYFGSSTATSGVAAGAKVATGGTTTSPTSGVPAALQEAKALTHDAELDLARINNALTQAPAGSPDRDKLQTLLDDSQKIVDTIHAKAQSAIEAASRFGTSTSDAENSAAAADVIKARDEIKQLAATVKAKADEATKPKSTPTP